MILRSYIGYIRAFIAGVRGFLYVYMLLIKFISHQKEEKHAQCRA